MKQNLYLIIMLLLSLLTSEAIGQDYKYIKKFGQKELNISRISKPHKYLITIKKPNHIDTVVFDNQKDFAIKVYSVFDSYLTDDKLIIVANNNGIAIDFVTFEKKNGKWHLSLYDIISYLMDEEPVSDIKILNEKTIKAKVSGKQLTYKINYKEGKIEKTIH